VTSGPIRIATRGSNLALWQANHIAARLRREASRRDVELVHVSTTGDRDRTAPLSSLGSFGVFTREVQRAVLDGRADLAVHSLKDLPTDAVDGLILAAVPERESRFDVLVLPPDIATAGAVDVQSLPTGAKIGTGSLRRRAQVLHTRPDVTMLDVRGNVETRIAKLADGQFDALILAEAGLRRLSLERHIACVLRPPLMFPAVGQGALGIECRSEDDDIRSLLESINDPPTQAAVRAERSLLAALRAGCHAPLGVFTEQTGETLTLEAVVLSQDGRDRLHANAAGTIDDPAALGHHVAEKLRQLGADDLIAAARQ